MKWFGAESGQSTVEWVVGTAIILGTLITAVLTLLQNATAAAR